MFKKKEIQHLHHHILCHLCLLWTLLRIDKKSINEQRKFKNIISFAISRRQIESFCYYKIIYQTDITHVNKISHRFKTIRHSNCLFANDTCCLLMIIQCCLETHKNARLLLNFIFRMHYNLILNTSIKKRNMIYVVHFGIFFIIKDIN